MPQDDPKLRLTREIAEQFPREADVLKIRNSSPAGILNSWKEIAVYLQRGVRTVQRWEYGLGLPVHRIGKGKRSPVFANGTELNFWLATARIGDVVASELKPSPIRGSENPDLQSLRELRVKMHNLSHSVAEASVRQRRLTELARQRLLQLRSRMKRAS